VLLNYKSVELVADDSNRLSRGHNGLVLRFYDRVFSGFDEHYVTTTHVSSMNDFSFFVHNYFHYYSALGGHTVLVQVLIDEEGNVIAAKALEGHPLLQAVSVAAAREAKFSPTLLEGEPVKVTGVIQYNFFAR
jgi:Gram-negative bacterial TonB protein C-terminal